MNRLKNNYYGHVCAVILSTVLISSANAVELEDESQNSIFHEVKGNLSFDKFGTSLGLYNGRHSTTIPVVSVPGNTELEVAVYLQQYPESKYTTPQPFAVPMITGVLPCGYDEPVWRDYLEDLIDSDFTTGVSSPGSPAPHAGMWLHIPGMSAERLGNKGNNNVSASTLNNYYYECTDNYPGQGNYPGDAPDFSMTIEVHAPNGHKYVFDQMAFDYGPDAVEFGEGILYASYVEDPFGNRVSFNQEDGIVSSISASDGRRITFNYSGDHKSDSATVTMSTNGRDWVWQGRWGEKPKIVGNSYEWGAQRSLTLPDNTTWTFDATDQTGIEATSACNDQSGELVIKNPTGAKLTLTLDNIVVFAAYRSGSVTKLPPKNQYNCKDFWKLTYANQLRRKSEHGAVKQATIAAPGVSTDYVWNIEYEEGWGRTVSVNPSFALERTVSKPDGSSLRYQFESHSAASFITNIISTEVLDKNNNILASYYPEYMFSRRVLTIHGDDTGAASGGRAQKEHQTLLSSAVTKIGSDVFTTTYKYSETNNLDKYNIPSQITRSSVHGGTARAVDFTYRNLSLDSEGIYRVGLLATEKRNNKLFVTNTYTDYGSLETAKSFNSSAATSHVYYTSGLLKKTISPIGRVDEYSQYKRGIPKTTIKAKGTGDQITLIREVDNNGWVTSETDAMGFSVSIEHDDLGRVDKVSYPGRNRAAENIIYSNLGSGLKE